MTSKADRLVHLAQSVAGEHELFFEIKGPGVGDRDTRRFMKALRTKATDAFAIDHSEKELCGSSGLRVDFYFRDEGAIVEVALSLRNPTSEFERDVFKAVLAAASGNPVKRLVFISKPGAAKRLAQPGAKAIIDWLERTHNIRVDVRELLRSPAA